MKWMDGERNQTNSIGWVGGETLVESVVVSLSLSLSRYNKQLQHAPAHE
jgi:hypothetical protein